MDWVKWLLQLIKPFVIIVLVVVFTILWLKVPESKLNEPEVKYAPKQSKRST